MLVSNHLKFHSHQLTYVHNEFLSFTLPRYPQSDVLQKLTLLIPFIKWQQIKEVNDPCEVKQKALTYDRWLLCAHSSTQLITAKRINGVCSGCRLYSIFPSLVLPDRYKVWHSQSLSVLYVRTFYPGRFGQFLQTESLSMQRQLEINMSPGRRMTFTTPASQDKHPTQRGGLMHL